MADALPALWENAWLFYAVFAVMISLFIHGAIYALSRAFHLNELEISTKAEIMQALATAFLAVFLVLIVGGVSDYVDNQMYGTVFCGGQSVTIQGTGSALYIVQCRIIEKARALEQIHNDIRLDADDRFREFYSSFSIVGIPVFSGQYSSNLYEKIENLRFKNTLTTTLLIALNALITLVAYVKSSMLMFFLPFGLLLRSFHFTRGIGSLLIAIAIGFYFVFPYVFIVTDPGFIKLPPSQAAPRPGGSDFCYPTFSSVITMFDFQQGGSATSGSDFVLTSDLSRIYASIILQPLAAFFITIVFVRYLMYLFGEESYDVLRMVTRLV